MSFQQQPQAPATPTSPESEIGSTYSSPHRRRGQTRREALNRILTKNRAGASTQRPAAGDSTILYERAAEIRGNESLPSFPQDPHVSPGTELSKRFIESMHIHSNVDKKRGGEGGTTVTTASSSESITHLDGYSALPDDLPEKQVIDDGGGETSRQYGRQTTAQHLTTHEEHEADAKYYRITYQGVVALLSEPHRNSQKSGAYVSYGEIIMSRHEVNVDDEENTTLDSATSATISPHSDLWTTVSPESPTQSVLSQTATSVSSLDTLRTASTAAPSQITQTKSQTTLVGIKRLVRVDQVLTGGYAIDATDAPHLPEPQFSATPKHNNLAYVPMVGPCPLPLSDSNPENDEGASNVPHAQIENANYGYLYTRKKNMNIAERLSKPPLLQTGTFLFKIVSSAPLPILTGPCIDAPRTRAMLLPGTVHEVCLKMTTDESDLCFLRLSHRRGWITDRRVTALGGVVKIGAIPAAKEVTDAIGDADDITVSAISLASASMTSNGSSVRRRHRPPRRKREAAAATAEKSGLPRHIGGQPAPTTPSTTPQKNESPGRARLPDKLPTPNSNVSILSDDESFDLGSSYRFPSGLTPDRSVSSSRKRNHDPLAPTFFLMLVNAPRGLKILDAPHFQVSNLIHGKNEAGGQTFQPVGTSPSPSKGIFQTMSTHQHTTKVKVASRIGNPAIFDSITKTRVLPRGVVFEASKRMEASTSFNKGAGLVKLSDDSGWAVIPHQSDLDAQYRSYQGGAADVKEGEATRAFEEVGNAIVDTEAISSNPPIWVRVVARNGVQVSCPPPVVPVVREDNPSPTSSTGSSSNVSGGGSNYGVLSGADSDVASSVGSAFLDAILRTPKKRNHKTVENRTLNDAVGRRKDRRPILFSELQDMPTILPCGSCVEVDRWEDATDGEGAGSAYRTQDYVRLRGGQGWIPLNEGGVTVSAVIPKPDIRLGSFWFRVTSRRGIKVRLGPSRRAGSIKSDDGIYFRFECGEFLRASEVITIFHNHDEPSECYAKLYRNRHVRLSDSGEYRQLLSLTTPAEWVQVFCEDRLFLEECGAEPEILRHREGWRYNVVADSGVEVRIGPSLNAECTGVELLVGESVVVTERVTAPGEEVAWLRLKDGDGWVCDTDLTGRAAMIAHSLRHRHRLQKAARPEREDIAYNSIVARLFHDGVPGSDVGESSSRMPRK